MSADNRTPAERLVELLQGFVSKYPANPSLLPTFDHSGTKPWPDTVGAPYYEMPSREKMDAAAKRFIDADLHKFKTIQEQSMDWAREMNSKVALEKEQAIVQALITAMIAAGQDVLRIEPRHVIRAQEHALHRHTDPITGDWVMELKRKDDGI